MKKAIILSLIALAACSKGEPAPHEYWHHKMCVQPRYKNLEQCKDAQEDNYAAIAGIIGQM